MKQLLIVLICVFILKMNGQAQAPQYFHALKYPAKTAPGFQFINNLLTKDSLRGKKVQCIYYPSFFPGMPNGIIKNTYIRIKSLSDTGLITYINGKFSIKFGQTTKSAFHGPSGSIDTFITGLNPFHFSDPFTFTFKYSTSTGDTEGKWIKIPGNVGQFAYNKNSNFVMELSFSYPFPKSPIGFAASYGSNFQNMWGWVDTFRSVSTDYLTLDIGFDITPSGVDAVSNITAFGLFPNPSSDGRFNVSFDTKAAIQAASVVVTNVTGQQVLSQAYHHIGTSFFKEINMSEVAKGIYFVTIVADGERIVRRVVLE